MPSLMLLTCLTDCSEKVPSSTCVHVGEEQDGGGVTLLIHEKESQGRKVDIYYARPFLSLTEVGGGV